jgi:endonuclease YncB( thermonuclease family)
MRLRLPLAVVLVAVALATAAAPAAAQDRDCRDFPDQRSAQAYYESKGGPGRDLDRLDADSDGQACDSLPWPCAAASRERQPAKPRRPRRPRRIVFTARIVGVVDGDTVQVRRGRREFRVRLLGVDTPEIKGSGEPRDCGGDEALTSMLFLTFTFPEPKDTNGDGTLEPKNRGRRVRVATDPTQSRYDRFRRLLAYVKTTETRKDLALAQIRAGLGKVDGYRKRFQRYERYREAEAAARDKRAGLWRRCGGDFHRPR